MLRRLSHPQASAEEVLDANGAPFASTLEFNPPAHGTPNIVHIGMGVPEAHQIYVCATNCMRGVVLTAQEMGAEDRFSCVVLKEEDITRGTVEEITLEGISDVLTKLEAHGTLPPCVIVFPVCTHLFLGVSMTRVYRELEDRWPAVDFVHAFMDPISRKRIPPDVRLRKEMYEVVDVLPPIPQTVIDVGSDYPLEDDADIVRALEGSCWEIRSIHDTKTYDEFKALGSASIVICTFPGGDKGARALAKRLGRPYYYLPKTLNMDEIEDQINGFERALGLRRLDHFLDRGITYQAFEDIARKLKDFHVEIDAQFHPRPVSVARLLAEFGMQVDVVYADVVAPEEAADLTWLSEHSPATQVAPMVAPTMRTQTRHRDWPVIALGQRAAYFSGTTHFVNMVEGAGLWGYAGARKLAYLMEEAAQEDKDTRDLIVRKGLGCESVI